MPEVFGVPTPLPPVATSTTRAAIDAAATPRGARKVFLQLDPDADKKHFIGDSTVVAAGTAGVVCALTPGSGVTLDVNTTSGLYVVAGTGGTASKLYVSVIS